MLLSDRDIRAEVDSGRVRLDPYTPELIQPSSIDVRLDRYFRVFENHRYPHIDPAVEQPDLTRLVQTEGKDPFVLHPGEFVLASTYEVVSLPDDVAGRLEGKSSLGRLGLLTHSTAGWIDPGFSGHVTLELSNVATLPIKLWPGMKIGQLCLFRTSSPAEHPYGSSVYGSRYQDQRGPTPSRSYLNFYRDRRLVPGRQGSPGCAASACQGYPASSGGSAPGCWRVSRSAARSASHSASSSLTRCSSSRTRRIDGSVIPSSASRTTYWITAISLRVYRRCRPLDRDGTTTPKSSSRRRKACWISSMAETCPTVNNGRFSSSNGSDGMTLSILTAGPDSWLSGPGDVNPTAR